MKNSVWWTGIPAPECHCAPTAVASPGRASGGFISRSFPRGSNLAQKGQRTMSNRKRSLRLRDGTVREVIPGEVIPEGASLHVPITLKDGLPLDADDEREFAYAAMRQSIHDAWKPIPDAPHDSSSGSRETADASYEEMKASISTAWQGA